jgi:hypothetical protein
MSVWTVWAARPLIMQKYYVVLKYCTTIYSHLKNGVP